MEESSRIGLLLSYSDRIRGAVKNYCKCRKLPPYVNSDDMYQIAMIACMRSAIAWDEARGEFWRYICPRIYGSMADYLRSEGWYYRRYRGNDTPPLRSMAHLSSIAAEMPKIYKSESQREREFREFIRERIPGLNPSHVDILALQFLHGYKAREVAKMLGVCDSRISQIMSDIRKIACKNIEEEVEC